MINPKEGGIRLSAVDDKEITKTDFFNMVDVIIDDPKKVKKLSIFLPLWAVK